MYSNDTISNLNERIKWNASLDPGFSVTLSTENETGTSGKHFQSFHPLVSIDNIYSAVPEIGMNQEKFNALLSDIRLQATLQAVSDVMDQNTLYVPETNYSDLIIANNGIFDNAIGYKVAINVLEMFMSTTRSNLVERNAKLAVSNLKLELEGFKNDYGVVVANGIKYYYQKAIRKASDKLFPLVPTVDSQQIW